MAGGNVAGRVVFNEGFYGVAHGMDGCFMARVEQQNGRCHQFVFGQFSSFILGADQFREKVFSRIFLPCTDQITHVSREFCDSGHGFVFNAAVTFGHVHGDVIVGPGEKLRGHFKRRTQQIANHLKGNWCGIGRQ